MVPSKRKIDFQEAENTVLLFMYMEFDIDGRIDFEIWDLEKALDLRKNLVRMVVDTLVEQKHINKRTETIESLGKIMFAAAIGEGVQSSYEVILYRITKNGIEYIESLEEKYIEKLSYNISGEKEQNYQNEADQIPASDRIVTLSHNSSDYAQAIESLNAATEAIRGFNGATAYDKEHVVGELEAARTLLKSTRVRVTAILTVALAPLYTVYHDAAAEALKPVVLQAIEALKTLIN